jgi:hypothetical protein
MSKSVWGPATWSMLHCLVLKIKDDATNIEQMKTLISSICDNLPCPYCASHARTIIQKSNFSGIQDILSLRVFVFQLHNKVNEKLKKPQMEYSVHLEKYKNLNLIMVINTFIKAFNNNSGTTMMLYSFHKKQVIEQLRNYFKNYASLYVLN